MLLLTAPAYSTAGYDKIVERAKTALTPDAQCIQDFVEKTHAAWNATGVFDAVGFTDSDSDGIADSGEAFTDVRTMGCPGGLVEGLVAQSDGLIKVFYALPTTTSFPADGADSSSYYAPIMANILNITPYSIGADMTRDVVNGSSTIDGNEGVQITTMSCAIYDDSSGTWDYALGTENDDVFVAKKAVQDLGQTASTDYVELDVSYADQLPGLYKLCYGLAE